jgi:hypothetical protein
MANGYANRFLFAVVKRSKVLPFGGALSEEAICDLGRRTAAAIKAARNISRVMMTSVAKEDWRKVYPVLSEGEPGLLGAIIGRAEAQVIRLALIYALFDRCAEIDFGVNAGEKMHQRAGVKLHHGWVPERSSVA